jgi:hypothetical protein
LDPRQGDVVELLQTSIYLEITSSGGVISLSGNTSDYMEMTVYYNASSTSYQQTFVLEFPATTIFDDKPKTMLLVMNDVAHKSPCMNSFCYRSAMGDGIPYKIGLRYGRKPSSTEDSSLIISNFWIQVNQCPNDDCGAAELYAYEIQMKAYSMEPENPARLNSLNNGPTEFPVALLSEWL